MQPALFILCAGNELFYCLLYLLNFSEGLLGRKRAGQEDGRGFWPAQGDEASSHLGPFLTCIPFSLCCPGSLPTVGSVGLFRMGLWITAPIALLKSVISVIHLVTAARNMAVLDAADRAKKK